MSSLDDYVSSVVRRQWSVVRTKAARMSSEGMPTVRLDSRIQWEYRVAQIPASHHPFDETFDIQEIGDYLNGVGEDGWELVSTTPVVRNSTVTGLIAVLKRQR